MWVYVYEGNEGYLNVNETISVDDGQLFFQNDTNKETMYTWNRLANSWATVSCPVLASNESKVQLHPGGFYHRLIRLDSMNCNVWNKCNASGAGSGSYYTLRQSINIYNSSGSLYTTINSSTSEIVFAYGYGFTKANSPSEISGTGVGIRVYGYRNKSTGAVTKFNGEYFASELYKSSPTSYLINTL
ncbi:hypothetical protein SAMN05428961_1132 [Paenibacillus sp. OK060]|uniref:hypothetical protein n=1 Tax=Paenibacillus sp. OK060 TaxID=1881034 RepID=UPI0008822C72|nr:hypothetical protein [Paenibacillus sp. OK060]SDM29297.1 hypothetical protein SAMN05428961_1132 [Paenibacillus sp. OK060]